jgi:OmpA family
MGGLVATAPGTTTDDRFYEVYFDSAAAALTRRGEDVKVRRAAEILKQDASLVVRLEGHASTEGNLGHNQWLSEERAKTVKQLLVSAGVDPSRIADKGFGATQPVVPETERTWAKLEAQRGKNRRVAVTIHPKSAPPAPAPAGWVFNPLQTPPPQPLSPLNPIDPEAMRKAVRDLLREKGLPPIPPQEFPDWFWKPLPPQNSPQWKDYIEKVQKWCKDHHVDPNIFIQGLKDKLLPDKDPPALAPPSDPPGWPDKPESPSDNPVN